MEQRSTNAGKPGERRGKKPEQSPEVDGQRKYRTELLVAFELCIRLMRPVRFDAFSKDRYTLAGFRGNCDRICVSPDGRTFAAAYIQQHYHGKQPTHIQLPKIWDVATHHGLLSQWQIVGRSGKVLAHSHGTGPSNQLADIELPCRQTSAVSYTPDDGYIAAASDDGCVRFWNREATEIRLLLRAHETGIRSMAFSEDGRLETVSSDETVRVWSYRMQEGTEGRGGNQLDMQEDVDSSERFDTPRRVG
ncbi:hypothetical protein CCMA1212_010627 [Trichoderma ghanense]|uniref:Uncharacterized protein n=1 Tax=Trichoderma ghanense TaxID=65468 RepID=A0ABY2GPJ4_9HYPO